MLYMPIMIHKPVCSPIQPENEEKQQHFWKQKQIRYGSLQPVS